ncbi:MAG: hypothetical protein MUO34_05715, partial [Ignavibacteriaceae bacterium]|nr:hypothetical protein [Ignavibacteriaceae bacterium]
MKSVIFVLSVLFLTSAFGQEKKATTVQEKKTTSVQEKKMTSEQEKKTTKEQEKKVASKTGDEDMDRHLAEIDKYGKSDFEGFKRDLSLKFGASTKEVNEFRYREKMSPADIYHGYTLSSSTGKSPQYVMNKYREQKSWGKVAQELGIKPGSKEFHKLKGKS